MPYMVLLAILFLVFVVLPATFYFFIKRSFFTASLLLAISVGGIMNSAAICANAYKMPVLAGEEFVKDVIDEQHSFANEHTNLLILCDHIQIRAPLFTNHVLFVSIGDIITCIAIGITFLYVTIGLPIAILLCVLNFIKKKRRTACLSG